MKRMKGLPVPFDPSSSPYEDPRIRRRHQSLMQDYEDLYRETEAQRDKLETMKKKKMTLLAEVRFLRQRYQYLKQSQYQNPKPEPKSVQRPKLVNGSKTARKERIDLKKKKKNYNEKNAASLMSIPDLNQKERIYSGKEASARNNTTPIFDLNQISMEEEEMQANDEGMKIDEARMCLTRGGSDDQHGDMKLSACRTVGNGSSRAGKRKISWQDQLALRV